MKTGILEGSAKDRPNYHCDCRHLPPTVPSALNHKIGISAVKKDHMHDAAGG